MSCCNRSDMCASSPNGKHCFCVGYTGTWFGINPPQNKCCWCGQPPAPAHGPYRWNYCISWTITSNPGPGWVTANPYITFIGGGGSDGTGTLNIPSGSGFSITGNSGQSYCNVAGCNCSNNKK